MEKITAVVLLALTLIGSTPVCAQVRLTLEELGRELAPGDAISIVQSTGESVTGRLVRVGDADLAIRADTARPTAHERRLVLTIPFDTIQTLERRRDSARNGAVIGATIGGGFVGAMFARAIAIDRNEMSEWAPIYAGYGALFAGIGALIGWGVDSANSKPHIRFDARGTRTITVRVAPLLARRRGMEVRVAF